MNKWMTISIISVLAIGVVVAGGFYFQETDKLKDAQTEIVGLEGNVSTLQTELATAEAEVSTLEGDLAVSEAEISALESDVSALEGNIFALETELAATEAEVSILEGDLAVVEVEVSTLESNLATANARSSTLEAELADAEAKVSNLEIELAAALGSTKVYLTQMGFVPTIIAVTVGTTVTWTNIDIEGHSVNGEPLFNSDILSPGDSFSHTFTQQGVFNYGCGEPDCSIHDSLYGTVIVE